MSNLPEFESAIGTARDLSLTAYDPDTGAVWSSRWAAGDTLAASAWAGDANAASWTPTAAWVDATAGTFTVKWDGAATSSLAVGRYRLQVRVTDVSDSNRVHVLYEAWIKLTESPGAVAALATYVTYDEVLKWVPGWISDLQERDDQAGFAEQRNLARKWTDNVIQRHYRRDSFLPRQDTLDDLWYGYGLRFGEHDTTLQGHLDDDRLVLTTPAGQEIKRANAYYVAHLLAEGQIGTQGETDWARLSSRYKRMAEATITQVTAGIDTTTVADGVEDMYIDLSVVDRLRA